MEQILKSTLAFLDNLKKNNNRDWFLNNRPDYIKAKENFELFTQAVIDTIAESEPIFKGLEARSCLFRINRDIRFSNDKSPYKTNFGAFIVRGGKKNSDKFAGYYIHIEPGNSFIAGGAYMPPSQWLSEIREKIDAEPEKLKRIINGKDFIKYFNKIDGDKLKKAPKGYPADHPNVDILKYKSYHVVSHVPDKTVLSTGYSEYVLTVLKTMKPFNDFLTV